VTNGESLPGSLGEARKRSSRKIILAVILVAVLMLGAIALLTVQIVSHPIEHGTHNPISIVGNGGFTHANGIVSGRGMASDPYIIADWDINASTAHGILISDTYAHFIVRNCHVHDGLPAWDGIDLVNCANGILENNTCSNNRNGITLSNSSNIALSGNAMSKEGIVIVGDRLSDWTTYNIDATNTVNGKPVCYYKNQRGLTVPAGAGQVILVNCTHFIIENQNLSYLPAGIEIRFCSDCILRNNTCSNNRDGIDLSSSSGNTLSNNTCNWNLEDGILLGSSSNNNALSNNTCASNSGYGVDLSSSNDNTLISNTCSSNSGWGIGLLSSSNNTLTNNNCSNHNNGIYLDLSNDNTLSNNSCSSNGDMGIYLEQSSKNALINNTCSSVAAGIIIAGSNSNALLNNTCSSCHQDGIGLEGSSNNTLTNNTCNWNGGWGICLLSSSNNNEISRNLVSNNALYGVNISSSSDNRIWNNTLIYNNGATNAYTASHVQAYDDGTHNWWNSTDGYGNYWSDWTTPDNTPPHGIVDLPYDILGVAGAKDSYPLTTPPVPVS
jgi:parallel beta-helix repeat protein